MNYPDYLKIGAHDYHLVLAPYWEGSDDGDLGQTFYEKQQIYLKSGMPHSLTFATLIHEVLHVINPQLDHVLLESLAEQISQVLLDNGLVDEE